MHLDQHLTCPHLWHGGVLVAENFGPSTLVGAYRLHRVQGADPGSELNAALIGIRSSLWNNGRAKNELTTPPSVCQERRSRPARSVRCLPASPIGISHAHDLG